MSDPTPIDRQTIDTLVRQFKAIGIPPANMPGAVRKWLGRDDAKSSNMTQEEGELLFYRLRAAEFILDHDPDRKRVSENFNRLLADRIDATIYNATIEECQEILYILGLPEPVEMAG